MQNLSMIYGCARVSTEAQDLTGQLALLKAAGCEKLFLEKITGTTAERPQLRRLVAALAPGDVVITPAVDRLSHDTTDLMVIARDMHRAGLACGRWGSRCSIPRGILPSLCSPCWEWPRSWNAAALPSARHVAAPMPRRRV